MLHTKEFLPARMPYKDIFIDSTVSDRQTLINGADSHALIIVLERDRDGVAQITEVLQQYQAEEIHIVTHGIPGSLKLGSSKLSLETLSQYSAHLQKWFNASKPSEKHFSNTGALYLYGCRVAAGDAGAEFINRLGQLTNANIAASASYTGNSALNGNWNLESTVGSLSPTLAFSKESRETYSSVLASPFNSDDFNSATLDPQWTFVDSRDDGGSVALTGTGTQDAYLELSVPGGTSHDLWRNDTSALRVMQAANDEDFQLAAKFASEPSERYQLQGILVQQDSNDWIRFDTFHDGNSLQIFSAVTTNGNSQARINQSIPPGSANYLRVSRTGNNWTLEYSANGNSWRSAGSFNKALNVTEVGTFAGNADGSPAFTSQVDYFFNTAAPIVPEDGNTGSLVLAQSEAITSATASATEGNDIITSIDINSTNYGQGKVDTLTGLGGADTFILGDKIRAYYDDGTPSSSGETDYALITDFNISQQDSIQLHGRAASYQLGSAPDGLPNVTAIFLQSSVEEELIGIVQGTSNLTLTDPNFVYA